MKNLRVSFIMVVLFSLTKLANGQWTSVNQNVYLTTTTNKVGIGNTSPAYKLDVSGTGRFTGKVKIGTYTLPNTDGTFGQVLTTNGSGTVTWVSVSGGGGSGWSLTGNAGTSSSANFIGTIDNVALRFKTNNQKSGLIDPVNGNTGLGHLSLNGNTSGVNNTAIGRYTLANNNANDNTAVGSLALTQNTSGFSQVAVGLGALGLNTTGYNNSAFGYEALYNNTSGNQNTAIGTLSMFNGTTQFDNTACGNYSLYSNTTGARNTAIGLNALYGNTTGNYNSALGYNATVSSGGLTNATAIGAYAMASQNNTVVIGSISGINGATSSANVGIGTTTPAYKLDVCGTIRAKEIRVETGWCDYVFANDYKLAPLSEVESFIKENKHLPNVTAGPVIESEGLEVGKVASQMIRKIEELTLYAISFEKKQAESANKILELTKQIEQLQVSNNQK